MYKNICIQMICLISFVETQLKCGTTIEVICKEINIKKKKITASEFEL